MGEIASSDRQITFYYNGESLRAKKTLALVSAECLHIREIDILKTPLTRTQIEELAQLLGLHAENLVNKDHPYFAEHFNSVELNEPDWLKLIQHNPKILKQPIAIKGSKAVLIDTPTDILKL
jgi:arsenate reductase